MRKYRRVIYMSLSTTRVAMHVCSKLRNVVGCRNYLFFFLRRYRVRILFWMIYTVWRCWQHALYRMHVLRVEVPLNILRTCALLRGPCTIATVVVLLSNGLRVVWSYKISPSVCARMLVCCVAFSLDHTADSHVRTCDDSQKISPSSKITIHVHLFSPFYKKSCVFIFMLEKMLTNEEQRFYTDKIVALRSATYSLLINEYRDWDI